MSFSDQWIDATIKRFKCPDCEDYSVYVESSHFAQCENGHFIDDKTVIANIVGEDNYDGIWTEEDVRNKFY